MISSLPEQVASANRLWAAGEVRAAIMAQWKVLRLAPADRSAKVPLVRLLFSYPSVADPEMAPLLLDLLRDPEVGPEFLSRAGWLLLGRMNELLRSAESDGDLENLATWLESEELAMILLNEAPVGLGFAETVLTRIRRWLAVSGQWRNHEALVASLTAQANLNGGAWFFDEAEERLQGSQMAGLIAGMYLPVRVEDPATRARGSEELPDRVTRAVAAQYERWPYPIWRRLTYPVQRTLPEIIRRFDGAVAGLLAVKAKILVAGCGTGREAARVALRCPDAAVTAIDISQASLNYARRQCELLAIPGIRFIRWDLNDAPALGEEFDAIYCSGVIHHLPDPEAGWKALSRVLRPGGVMKIMVYSRLARLGVNGARLLLGGLKDEPVDDNMLRRVRNRLMTHKNPPAPAFVLESRDFSTLAGTHDLRLHCHEIAFDIPRIVRGLNQTGLRLLSFLLPTPPLQARYDSLFRKTRCTGILVRGLVLNSCIRWPLPVCTTSGATSRSLPHSQMRALSHGAMNTK